MKNNDFQRLLQNFFLEWMMKQKKVSPSTIQTYKKGSTLKVVETDLIGHYTESVSKELKEIVYN